MQLSFTTLDIKENSFKINEKIFSNKIEKTENIKVIVSSLYKTLTK